MLPDKKIKRITVGFLIKEYRKSKGLSIKAFNSKYRIFRTSSYLSNIECSKVLPSISVSIKVAEIIGYEQKTFWEILKGQMVVKFRLKMEQKYSQPGVNK